ncbi:RNA polymerase II elongation factor ELL2 [Camelus ferus]|nr:RNA polymerase II elongation factor ELL2 [Camelus ferus]
MSVYGGRAVRAVVHQDGDVVMEETASIEPRQGDVSVLPRQLTSPAIQPIDSFGNHENTVPPQAAFQFQGHQGLLIIPPDNSPTDIYNFDYQLSNVHEDNYQDHTQPTVSSCSPSQPRGWHLVQDEMTECKTTDSYQTTQTRKTQGEEEPCNRGKRFRRPDIQKRKPVRKAPQANPDPVPERKRTAPINPAYTVRKSRVANRVHMRPLRDRVIHLLALRDYKKPELFVRLQKDGIPKNNKNSLGKILQQVASLNPRTLSYTLKDYAFKELQRDWPGYNELDRQTLDLVLSRKLCPFQNATGTNPSEASLASSRDETLSPSEEQLLDSAVIDCSKNRKVRISHVTTTVQTTSSGHLSDTSNSSAAGHSPPLEATPDHIMQPSPTTYLPSWSPPQPVSSSCSSCSSAEGPEAQDSDVDSFSQNSTTPEGQEGKCTFEKIASISIQMKCSKNLLSDGQFRCKITEHKVKNQEYTIKITQKPKTDREGQGEGENLNSSEEVQNVGTASDNTCSTSDFPDYLTDYVTIVSSEQRQRYEQIFRVEYDEYKALYTKILTLSKTSISLNSKRKYLSPDSKEYQAINKKISLEYQKMKQVNPTYCAEKQRCQYLYKKLSHIKKLINNYDEQQIELALEQC